ncbi:L,D-transpeptidase family protein [Clostridium sp.]|uniref:L,D-transpeptidase n=1 Tax=Clostridium sp. TaxID=1506 RepID=UPI003F3EBD21
MKKIIGIIILSIFCQVSILATPKIVYFEKYLVGKVIKSEKRLISEEGEHLLYEMGNQMYISLNTLRGIGADIQKEKQKINITLNKGKSDLAEEKIQEGKAYINNEPIYIGNIRTYSLLVNDKILIPLEALNGLWEVKELTEGFSISDKYYDLNRYIKIDEAEIVNISPYFIRFKYKDIFWDGKEYIEVINDQELQVGEKIQREFKITSKEKKVIYLTSFLISIHELKQELDETNPYGQKNEQILKAYEGQVRLKMLESIFSPYIVTGTMKYPVGEFKAKEVVEIWRGEKKQYYIVIDKKGKQVFIPWDSVEIESDQGVKWDQLSNQEIEDYVNLKGIESETNYFVWTDLYRQKTYVLTGEKENWKIEKIMRCSSGRNTYLTPRGEFKLEYKMPYFGMGKGFMCKNAVVIFRDYMYHSILFDKTGNYIKEGKYQLGQRVSHGCIRLSEEESKWFYDNIPIGTKVWIN